MGDTSQNTKLPTLKMKPAVTTELGECFFLLIFFNLWTAEAQGCLFSWLMILIFRSGCLSVFSKMMIVTESVSIHIKSCELLPPEVPSLLPMILLINFYRYSWS